MDEDDDDTAIKYNFLPWINDRLPISSKVKQDWFGETNQGCAIDNRWYLYFSTVEVPIGLVRLAHNTAAA
jgi:hypothetical protein